MEFCECLSVFMKTHHVVVMWILLGATFSRYPLNIIITQQEPDQPHNKDDPDRAKQLILLLRWWKKTGKHNRTLKLISNFLFLIGPFSILLLFLLFAIFGCL